MAVEREEFETIASFTLEDHNRSVIERGAIVSKCKNCGIEWGSDRSAGISKQIDAKVNSASFIDKDL